MKEKYRAAGLIMISISRGGLVGVIAGLLDYKDHRSSLVYKHLFRGYITCVCLLPLLRNCDAYVLAPFLHALSNESFLFLPIDQFVTFVYALVLANGTLIHGSFLTFPSYPFLVIPLTFLVNLRGLRSHMIMFPN